jgi:hypothetical protein
MVFDNVSSPEGRDGKSKRRDADTRFLIRARINVPRKRGFERQKTAERKRDGNPRERPVDLSRGDRNVMLI